MALELLFYDTKDDGRFGMELPGPAKRLIIKYPEARVLAQPLAGLAPPGPVPSATSFAI